MRQDATIIELKMNTLSSAHSAEDCTRRNLFARKFEVDEAQTSRKQHRNIISTSAEDTEEKIQ